MPSALEDTEMDLKTAILNATILEVFCHAIHTCIFFMAMYYHIAGNANRNRQQMIFAGIITYFWCSITVIVAFDCRFLNKILTREVSSLEVAASIVAGALYGLNIILADMLLIWRCWILYGRNWMIAGGLGLCMLIRIGANTIIYFNVPGTWNLVSYLMTAFINTLCTALTLYRIMRINGVRASLRTYGGMIEILVESAVLYSGIFIALAVTSVVGGLWVNYPSMLSSSLTGIAPTLIVVRVLAGHARPDDSWTRTSLPPLGSNAWTMDHSIRFASMHHSTTHTATIIDIETATELSGLARDGTRTAVTV